MTTERTRGGHGQKTASQERKDVIRCPDCAAQLHTTNDPFVLMCFNGPKYWERTDDGLVDVTNEHTPS